MKQYIELKGEQSKIRIICPEDESLSDSRTLGRLLADLLDKADCPRLLLALAEAIDTLVDYREEDPVFFLDESESPEPNPDQVMCEKARELIEWWKKHDVENLKENPDPTRGDP